MPNGSNEVEELLLEVGLGEGGAGLLVLFDVGNERLPIVSERNPIGG